MCKSPFKIQVKIFEIEIFVFKKMYNLNSKFPTYFKCIPKYEFKQKDKKCFVYFVYIYFR